MKWQMFLTRIGPQNVSLKAWSIPQLADYNNNNYIKKMFRTYTIQFKVIFNSFTKHGQTNKYNKATVKL